MTPIEKNIFVVDEQGNQYEATWPKRAKGLVKKGRARFIDENTICIACPPDIELEDKDMSENTSVKTVEAMENKNLSEKPTIGYCLEQIENIQKQTDHIFSAITAISAIPSGDPGESGSPGDLVGEKKAAALADVARCRETTNQKLIAFYEKMYDDLLGKKTKNEVMLDIVKTALANGEDSLESLDELNGLISNLIGLSKL